MTILQAFQQGLNPNDFFNGLAPSLSVVSGDNQINEPNTVLPQPLVVAIRGSGGVFLSNAPVTLGPVSGGGQVCLSASCEAPLAQLTVRTAADGKATVWFKTPVEVPSLSTIPVNAGTVLAAQPISFLERAALGNTVLPAPPRNVVVTKNADGSFDLTWENAAYNATGFPIRIRDQYGHWKVIGTVPITRTSAHVNADGTLAP